MSEKKYFDNYFIDSDDDDRRMVNTSSARNLLFIRHTNTVNTLFNAAAFIATFVAAFATVSSFVQLHMVLNELTQMRQGVCRFYGC